MKFLALLCNCFISLSIEIFTSAALSVSYPLTRFDFMNDPSVLVSGEYQVVEIGDCYAIDADDWDKPYKTYEKVGSWPNGFRYDFSFLAYFTVCLVELCTSQM